MYNLCWQKCWAKLDLVFGTLFIFVGGKGSGGGEGGRAGSQTVPPHLMGAGTGQRGEGLGFQVLLKWISLRDGGEEAQGGRRGRGGAAWFEYFLTEVY